MKWKDVPFSDLQGKTIDNIFGLEKGSELVIILCGSEAYRMHHDQDCCECVEVEDIVGDLKWMIGSPVLSAEVKVSENETPPTFPNHQAVDSFTWTYYEISTIKGTIQIRWYGTSNGYYSEGVDFQKEIA